MTATVVKITTVEARSLDLMSGVKSLRISMTPAKWAGMRMRGGDLIWMAARMWRMVKKAKTKMYLRVVLSRN